MILLLHDKNKQRTRQKNQKARYLRYKQKG